MERFLAKNTVEISDTKKAQDYVLRYVGELKLHFNLNDKDIEKILYNSYIQVQGQGILHKWFNMLKSFLRLN